ncbi:hypothetical protein ASPFODRAFT_53603 [Aspergillus luchuensis CBS 106.47]|uniref:Uncharacterized protein n=1 Tax=Aspergillus luchuensis (strain CBS 106.47) TaxID=1137211 RepID=A0A1M3T0J9_ASPLC|nr:hypothetical protein ASPFODRAFT_53603 [Aspergillus luchuensis CBS 106.47]
MIASRWSVRASSRLIHLLHAVLQQDLRRVCAIIEGDSALDAKLMLKEFSQSVDNFFGCLSCFAQDSIETLRIERPVLGRKGHKGRICLNWIACGRDRGIIVCWVALAIVPLLATFVFVRFDVTIRLSFPPSLFEKSTQ